MLAYPVSLEDDAETGCVVVHYTDFPNVHTSAEDKDSALLEAVDGLETGMMMLMDDKVDIPVPSELKDGQILVHMGALATAKVLLYIEMKKQGVKKAELCRRLNMHKQQVDRLLDLRHSSKIEVIEHALRVLGKNLILDAA